MLCALFIASPALWAETDGDFVKSMTAGEKALLPAWCMDTQSFGYGDAHTNTSPRAAHWIGLMGKTFWAAHHYCWAMIKTQRSRSPMLPPNTRAFWLQSAINDMYYVVNNATPDFVLLPEVLTRIGEAYVTQQDYAQANETFAKARQVKPDYWPPYVRWAEVLVRFGKRQEGLELVEQVIKLAPGDAELQRQFQLLKTASAKVVRAKPKADSGVRQGAAEQKPASAGPGDVRSQSSGSAEAPIRPVAASASAALPSR